MVSHCSLVVHEIEWEDNAGGTAEGWFLGRDVSVFEFLGVVGTGLVRLGAWSGKPQTKSSELLSGP